MLKRFALILPLISGALWGASGVFVRILTEAGFDNMTIVGIKAMVAAVFMFFAILIYNRDLFKFKFKDLWLIVVCGILDMLIMNILYNIAVKSLTLSFAAVLLSLSPVFVMILATFFFHEKITKKKVVCALMAIFGCVLLSGVFEGGALHFSAMGILCGVLAAVVYAFFSIFSKLAMERGYDAFTITFYGLVATSILVIPFPDYGTVGAFIGIAPLKQILFLIVYAIGTAVLPAVLYTLGLAYADAGKVSIIGSASEPSAAMLFGLILYSEIPSVFSIAGLIITIVALTILCKPDKEERLG